MDFGLVPYANFLAENGINFFAVASIEEALKLRSSGFNERLIMLTPYIEENTVQDLIQNNVILTIDSLASAKLANDISKKLGVKATAHIKIDTGLSRFGFPYESSDEISSIIKECDNIEFEGIFSHFSNSLAEDKTFSQKQFDRFKQILENLKSMGHEFEYTHICNSSAFFKYPEMRLNTARIGSAFIGNAYGPGNFLKRIGMFHTTIAKIRDLQKGDIIGYGNSYVVKKPTKIAILHTGYFDGIGITLEDQRFKFLSKAKRAFMNIKYTFSKDYLYLNIDGTYYKVLGQIGMYDTVIDITGKDFKENDDIYFPVRPILIDSSVERKYI